MPRRGRGDAPPQPAQSIEPPPDAALSRWTRIVAYVLLIGAVFVPTYVSRDGHDHFRFPKELLLYATVIVAAAVAAIGLTLRRITLDEATRRQLRIPALLCAAGVLWTAIATATSTNRALSVSGLIWASALVVLFLLAAWTLRHVSLHLAAGAILLPALANATVVLLQATQIWNPWVFGEEDYFRLTKNALLGNADDVGVYLAAPTLLAYALALQVRRGRFVYAAIAVYLTAGLLAPETLTAIGAFAVAMPLLLILWRPRLGLLAAAVLPFAIAVVLLVGPTRDRVSNVIAGIQLGRWGGVVSGRLVPYATAWKMFAGRPLVGVGPGCFKFHYMRSYLQVRDEHPEYFALSRTVPLNFGEAHNDHLQVLAEAGVPGYALLLAGVVFVAWRSLRKRVENERAALARTLGAPFAVLLFVIMLAQFPLQIAAPAYTYALIGALCVAWSPEDAA